MCQKLIIIFLVILLTKLNLTIEYQIFFSFLIFWTSCVLQFCQFIDANLFESRFHIIIFSVVLSPPSYHNNIIVEEASMLH